jgi:hypothetical protein
VSTSQLLGDCKVTFRHRTLSGLRLLDSGKVAAGLLDISRLFTGRHDLLLGDLIVCWAASSVRLLGDLIVRWAASRCSAAGRPEGL